MAHARPSPYRTQRPRFYLGTHQPHWLASSPFPLFVSHKRLARYKTLPVARCHWALDSGAFSELSAHGRWTLTPEEYVTAVRRYKDEIGKLDWAAPQDYMCEPFITAKTGLSVFEHQRRTVDNYLRLKELAPDLPFIPVLQGWQLSDYLACVFMYEAAGVDLTAQPVVGIGSVCRRQATDEIGAIVEKLATLGIRLHGFGVKTEGLKRYGQYLASSDSMAWSFRGRHVKGCAHAVPGGAARSSEANCFAFAQQWRRKIIRHYP